VIFAGRGPACAYRLNCECRDLGSDPTLWQREDGRTDCAAHWCPRGGRSEGDGRGGRVAASTISAFRRRVSLRADVISTGPTCVSGPETKPLFEAPPFFFPHVPGRLVTRTRRQPRLRRRMSGRYRLERISPADQDRRSASRRYIGSPGTGPINDHRPSTALGASGISPREHRLLNFFQRGARTACRPHLADSALWNRVRTSSLLGSDRRWESTRRGQ
jgi:hypothetical protein